jgi:hypothetical protein
MPRQSFRPCQLLDEDTKHGGEPGTYEATVHRLPHKQPPVSPLPSSSSAGHTSTTESTSLQGRAPFVFQHIPSLALSFAAAASSPPPTGLILSPNLTKQPSLSAQHILWPRSYSSRTTQGFTHDHFSAEDKMFHTCKLRKFPRL